MHIATIGAGEAPTAKTVDGGQQIEASALAWDRKSSKLACCWQFSSERYAPILIIIVRIQDVNVALKIPPQI